MIKNSLNALNVLNVQDGWFAEPLFTEEWLKQNDDVLKPVECGAEPKEPVVEDSTVELEEEIFNYDECYKRAQLCSTLEEFFEKYPDYYDYAYALGYFLNCKWFKKMVFPCGYWLDMDKLLFAAKRCTSKKDFFERYRGAHKRAGKLKLLDTFDWFVDLVARTYTEEDVIEESKKYTSPSEFWRCSPKYYRYATDNNLIDKMPWLVRKVNKPEYWNDKERCLEAMKLCKSKTDFRNKYRNAYEYSVQNGWLDEHLFEIVIKPNKKCFIAFVFQNKDVFVGYFYEKTKKITCENRVKKYCISNNLDIVEPIVLSDKVDINFNTQVFIDDYENNGYTVVNKKHFNKDIKEKHNKQVEENINNYIEFSKQFKSWKDFSEQCPEGYHYIRAHKRYKDCPWLYKTHINYTFDECKELVKLYKNRTELKTNNIVLYNYIMKNEWLNDLIDTNAKPKGYWKEYVMNNLQEVYKLSKQYNTINEFKKEQHRIYRALCELNLTETLTWLRCDKKPKGYWNNFDNCAEVSYECKTFTEFRKKYEQAYKSCKRHNWFDRLTWLENESEYDMETKEHWVYVYEDVENKYVYVGRTKDIRRDNAHNTQKKNGQYDRLKRYFLSIGYENLPEPIILKTDLNAKESLYWEDVYVKQYETDGWNIINKGATGINSGSLGYTKKKWKYETVLEIAKTVHTTKEFREKSYGAYSMAKKEGWLKEWYWIEDVSLDREYHNLNQELFIEFLNQYSSYKELLQDKRNRRAIEYAHYKKIDLSDVKWYKPKPRKNQ